LLRVIVPSYGHIFDCRISLTPAFGVEQVSFFLSVAFKICWHENLDISNAALGFLNSLMPIEEYFVLIVEQCNLLILEYDMVRYTFYRKIE